MMPLRIPRLWTNFLKPVLVALVLMPEAALGIVNGQLTNPTQSAEVVIIGISGGGCSGTVIGPRTIITAAHCVRSGLEKGEDPKAETDAIARTQTDEQFSLKCTSHELYPARAEADIALCSAPRALKVAEIARVSLDSKLATRSKVVQIFGFGCRKPGGTDREFGLLSVGEARAIRTTPTADVVAWMETSGAAVCFGDAGGGGFAYGPDGSTLIGIASRGDLLRRSWFALLSAPAIADWLRGWESQQDAPFCGIGGEEACRPRAAARGVILAAAGDLTTATSPLVMSQPAAVQPAGLQLTVVRSNPGETIRSLVRRTCGEVADSYLEELRGLVADYGFKSIDMSIVTPVDVHILPCPPVLLAPPAEDVTVTTDKASWTAWNWYQWALARRPGGWAYFSPPSDHKGAANFLEAFQKVNQAVNPRFNAYAVANSGATTLRVPLAPPSDPHRR